MFNYENIMEFHNKESQKFQENYQNSMNIPQGCSLSPLLHNVKELGNVISQCVHEVKYAVVGWDDVLEVEWKSHAGFL